MIRLIVMALIILFFIKSFRVVKQSEKLVIFRLGRFLNIAGPGIVHIIPLIDRGVKINLQEKVPEWQTLTEMELRERLKAIAKQVILK